jgi:hypothetical protein
MKTSKIKQIRLIPEVDEMLSEMSKSRKDKGELIKTKQAIVNQLIIKEFKREFKQGV